MKNPITFFFGKEAPEGQVPNRELLSLSAALTGQNMTYGYVANWLFYFMEKILHISPMTVGSINGIMRVWDSVNDPILGAVIDRHRFKSGEKLRPYHLLTPPVIGVVSALMFISFGFSVSATAVFITAMYLR